MIHEIPIASIIKDRYCPVYWLKHLYLSRRGDVFFPSLSYSNFQSFFKFAVLRARINVRLTLHSFRRGRASFLSSVDVPLNQIKERGVWKSNCVLKYISDPLHVGVSRELMLAKKFF